MATISELMAGKKPGEIKVRVFNLIPGSWFKPYYAAEGKWHGTMDNGDSDCFEDSIENWEIYTEPKKKVVWYEYAKTKQFESGSSVWLSVNPDLMPRADDCVYTPTGRTVEVEGE